MAPNIPDHYLWLGLGALTILLTHHISTSLHNVRTQTTTTHPTPTPIRSSSPTAQEDSIKTTSLLTLATSPNSEIRHSATKILAERFYASDAARKLLLRDLGSSRPSVQRRAKLAFRVLRDYGVFRQYGLSFGYGGVEPRGRWEGEWEEEEEGEEDEVGERGEEEEREVRRRRREAVVIHDGEGSVGAGDVYMRDREGVMSLDVGELVIDGVAY